MVEKAYKTMTNSGIVNITIGITVMVIGLTAGILAIVSGAKLLKNKKELTFYFERTLL